LSSSSSPILDEIIERLVKDLTALREALYGKAAPTAVKAPVVAAEKRPRLFVPTGETATAAGISQIIAEAAKAVQAAPVAVAPYFKELPWDQHLFTTAPQPVTIKGDKYDLGRVVDFVMVLPTIDAQIEFDQPVEPVTPVITGGTIFQWNLRVRTIYYKAVSETLQGQLYVFAAWWSV